MPSSPACEAGCGSHPLPALVQAAPTATPDTESQARRRRLKWDKLRAKHFTRTLGESMRKMRMLKRTSDDMIHKTVKLERCPTRLGGYCLLAQL